MMCPNLAGTWKFYGQPVKDGQVGRGAIDMTLRQHGTEVSGQLTQAIDPWTEQPPADPEATRAVVTGRLFLSDDSPIALIELVRLNERNGFKAIFTGIVSDDQTEITGHVVNNRGAHGTFVMKRVTPQEA